MLSVILVTYLIRVRSYKTCKYTYTNDTSKTNCKGWSNTGLDECKEKCFRNDLPGDCDQEGITDCDFVIWAPIRSHPFATTGHCHLATIETCEDLIASEDYTVYQLYTLSTSTIETAGLFFFVFFYWSNFVIGTIKPFLTLPYGFFNNRKRKSLVPLNFKK